MKILMTVLAIALLLPVAASAGYSDGELFNQLVVLLELDEGDQKKLAVAFVTLGENLYTATRGVTDESFDSRDMFEDFRNARSTFQEKTKTFLSEEQFEGLTQYTPAILNGIANAVALVRVAHFEESLGLDEGQVTALTLGVSEDLRRIVETFRSWTHWDLNKEQSIEMNKTIAAIRKDTGAGVQKILSAEQWTKLQKLLEEERTESG